MPSRTYDTDGRPHGPDICEGSQTIDRGGDTSIYGLLYLPRGRGGRGLLNIKNQCLNQEASLRRKLLTNRDPLITAVAREDAGYTPLSLGWPDFPANLILLLFFTGCVQQFISITSANGKICDNNFYFVLFGRNLEKIFNRGLLTHQNTLYFTRIIDPYAWMVSIVKAKSDIVTFNYRDCVDSVKSRCDIINNGARFRLLVKYCLMKKCLHVPVEFLVRTGRAQFFYMSSSIIGDEILSEILLSVLFQLSKIDFTFDLTNSSFLDLTWYVPDLVQLELVPCKSLGLSISFSGERAVIVNVASNSVGAENGNIKIGDVLDKLNDIHITSSCKGRLHTLLRSRKTKPISLVIAKAYNPQSKEFFMPIKTLFKDININCDIVVKQYEDSNDEVSTKKIRIYGYDLMYLGFVDVGSSGSVKQVEKAMKSMLWSKKKEGASVAYGLTVNRIDKKVTFEIGEIGVKVRDADTNEVNKVQEANG
ncbi:hypothetical protein NQ318_015175 [Aromia moschata]|uniref:PDZ domain-containing protein n=1 Tax=Aromia moschata TaxID=1265417 RepID=A0AAV8XXS7_9CUCU|nr:hypothetical protein NQ318_015175 [Aromia moschata]